jgi:hypothetical protein
MDLLPLEMLPNGTLHDFSQPRWCPIGSVAPSTVVAVAYILHCLHDVMSYNMFVQPAACMFSCPSCLVYMSLPT